MVLKEKNGNKIGCFYNSLNRREKGRFMKWLERLTEMNQRTLSDRIANDSWRNLERCAIESGIDGGSWKNS